MVLKISLSGTGFVSWIASNGASARADKIKAAMRKAQKQAIAEWTQLAGGSVGLALRFQPEAFGTLQLSERSTGYMRQQMRTLGKIYPYVAPFTKSGQISPSGTMRRLVLGGGYDIASKNSGGDTVTTQFSVTGARILNRLKDPWRTTYTREFLALDRGGRRDAQWITNRANELTRQYIFREMTGGRGPMTAHISGSAA